MPKSSDRANIVSPPQPKGGRILQFIKQHSALSDCTRITFIVFFFFIIFKKNLNPGTRTVTPWKSIQRQEYKEEAGGGAFVCESILPTKIRKVNNEIKQKHLQV